MVLEPDVNTGFSGGPLSAGGQVVGIAVARESGTALGVSTQSVLEFLRGTSVPLDLTWVGGKSIRLAVIDEVVSGRHAIGDSVFLMVTQSITHPNGTIAVPRGARVIATIAQSSAAGWLGKPGEVVVVPRSLRVGESLYALRAENPMRVIGPPNGWRNASLLPVLGYWDKGSEAVVGRGAAYAGEVTLVDGFVSGSSVESVPPIPPDSGNWGMLRSVIPGWRQRDLHRSGANAFPLAVGLGLVVATAFEVKRVNRIDDADALPIDESTPGSSPIRAEHDRLLGEASDFERSRNRTLLYTGFCWIVNVIDGLSLGPSTPVSTRRGESLHIEPVVRDGERGRMRGVMFRARVW
jgi:hypothetical protein